MSDGKTVVYVSDVDEATELCYIPISQPDGGEDWGLVTHGDEYTEVEFVYHDHSLTLTTEQYEILCDYSGCQEISVERATEEVLQFGTNAILDIRCGETPLQHIDNVLEEAVASVFVMQAETDKREWPTVGTNSLVGDY